MMNRPLRVLCRRQIVIASWTRSGTMSGPDQRPLTASRMTSSTRSVVSCLRPWKPYLWRRM